MNCNLFSENSKRNDFNPLTEEDFELTNVIIGKYGYTFRQYAGNNKKIKELRRKNKYE